MLEIEVKPFSGTVIASAALFALSCGSAPDPPQTRRVSPEELSRDLQTAREHLTPKIRSVSVTPSLPQPTHPSVAAAIRYFSTDRRTTIQNSLDRSAEFRTMVETVIAQHGLPPEIAYLPVIESGFRTGLTSRVGAHGMWQFMPPTAREYELRVDWWVDERADPYLATHAAAVYLKRLYGMFDDWPLALAAYNAGPGRVRRTLRATGASTFWELLDMKRLPKETRGYVPTFFATAAIVTNPEKYGFRLPPPRPPAHDLDEVVISGPVSLEFLAKQAGIASEILTSQNLAYHRGLLPPGRSVLRTTRDTVDLLARGADQWHRLDQTIPVSRLRVNGADSVVTLAARLSVDPDDIREMNELDGERLISGSTLWIPLTRAQLRRRAGAVASQNRRAELYEVARGDTLYAIARAHGTTVERLVSRNGLGTDATVFPGDLLHLD